VNSESAPSTPGCSKGGTATAGDLTGLDAPTTNPCFAHVWVAGVEGGPPARTSAMQLGRRYSGGNADAGVAEWAGRPVELLDDALV